MCLGVPGNLSFSKPLTEQVPVYPVTKKSGGVRMIHDPRLYHRTSQELVRRCLGPYYNPRSFQFTQRGLHAAIAEIKALVHQGFLYAARFDIRAFYRSFNPFELPTVLPLPKELADHAVVGRLMKVKMKEPSRWGHKAFHPLPSTHSLLLAARLGIPQGSACSTLVSSYCMSYLPWSPPPGLVLVNFEDDFLLLATSMSLLSVGGGMLADAVSDLPGGTFELKQLSEGSISDGVKFLGHAFTIKAGALKTSPLGGNIQYFWHKIARLDTQLGKLANPIGAPPDKTSVLEKLAELIAFVDGWRAAFSECGDIDELVGGIKGDIKASLSQLGFSEQDVKAHMHPSMGYSLAHLYY